MQSLDFSPDPILLPVVCLVLWSLVIMSLMAYSRLTAIAAAKLPPEAGTRTADLAAKLPAEVQWKADNYNHLMEQPTIFYAIALTLALAGAGDGLGLVLAWLYVALRIAHSLVQITVNKVLVRFSLFALSSLVLAAMAIYSLTILL